jgi:hypothetical protein
MASVEPVNTGELIAVRSPEYDRVSVLLLAGESWISYTATTGTVLTPLTTLGIVALEQEGPHIQELAVFDVTRKEWITHPLPSLIKGEVTPLLNGKHALFPTHSRVYVYNGGSGKWDILDLPGKKLPDVQAVQNAFLVQQDQTLFVYSLVTSAWSKGIISEPLDLRGRGYRGSGSF